MALNPPPLLPQAFLDEPAFPPQLQNYPFDNVNQLTDPQLLQILRDFIQGEPHDFQGIIVPLDFTKYTMDRLKITYGTPAHQPFRPIYVFHHYKGHPEKRNFDMSQKTVTQGVIRCVWKKYRRSYQIVGEHGGYKRQHRLSSALTHGPQEADSWEPYKLMEYLLEPMDYVDAGGPLLNEFDENQASNWSLIRIFVGTFRRG